MIKKEVSFISKNYLVLCVIFILLCGNVGILAYEKELSSVITVVDDDVGADYSSLQQAINAAQDFDTIFVHSGFYNESLFIDKPITIIGEQKQDTIIDGGKRSDVIAVLSEEVSISNLTIQNSSDSIGAGWSRAGISILASNTTVKDCIIRNNLLGIFAKHADQLTIENNLFYNDSLIIYPYDAFDTHRPVLKPSHFVHRIENNLVNDKPLIYLVDESDRVFSSEIGQLIAVNCTNVWLKNTSISSADFPVLLVFCTHCIIENVTFFENDAECTLLDSDQNMICSNLFQRNMHGLLLDYGSENNDIVNNAFVENRFCGVICEYFSDENSFMQNNFIENRIAQAFLIRSFRNEWIGNYWSDWIGLQSDLFRFFPKVITGTLFDNYQKIVTLFNMDRTPQQIPYEFGEK